jgi:DNA-binding transcriptional ArsR family regulator
MRARNTVGKPGKERRLVRDLWLALREDSAAKRRHLITCELDCFQGVADLVSGMRNGHRLVPRGVSPSALGPISFSLAKVLSSLSQRKVAEIRTIAQTTGLTPQTVRRQLSILGELRIIKLKPGGRVRVLHEIGCPFKQIDAYEVKVRDWRSGLRQALNYRCFANRVFLAMPLNRANALRERIDIFRRFNVGLVGIDDAGRLVWLFKARRQRPISLARSFLASIRLLQRGSAHNFRSSHPA